MPHPIYLIAAVDQNFGIGKNSDLPWRIKDDMLFFQNTTSKTKNPDKQNIVIMGRRTWESIPEKHRPLSNRKNIILTRQTDYQATGATIANSFEAALNLADDSIESIFVMGGGKIYHETISHPKITGVYLTHIESAYDCDTFFPQLPEHFNYQEEVGEGEEGGVHFKYVLHQKTPASIS